MKKQVLNILTVIALSATLIGCKKAKEADTVEAEEVAVTEAATAQKYVANATESVIEWKGFKPTGTHNGTVSITSGEFEVDNGALQSGTFVIDMSSITVLDLEGDMKGNLEAHLKGTVEGKEGDFFNINEFPSGKFEITGTSTDENGQAMLSGNLELKGNTQNITFPVTVNSEGDALKIVSESFSIDRTKWGVNYGSKSIFDNLGDKFINDDMELKILVYAKKS